MKLANKRRNSFFSHMLDAGEAASLYKTAISYLQQAEKAKQCLTNHNFNLHNASTLDELSLQEFIDLANSQVDKHPYSKRSIETYLVLAESNLYDAAQDGLAIAAAELAELYFNLAKSSSETKTYIAKAIEALQCGADAPSYRFKNFEQAVWIEYCQQKLLKLNEANNFFPTMQHC